MVKEVQQEDTHKQFVRFMLKKANMKDKEPEAFTILSPAQQDPKTVPQDLRVKESDIKAVEAHVERFKKTIK